MNRPRLALAVCVLFLAVPGCSEDGAPGGRTLQVQVSGEVEETVVYTTVVERFERANPDVDIELVAIPEKDAHLARLTTTFAAGDPPDVFLVNYREFSQFVARGGVEPVGPLLGDVGMDPDDYYPEPLEAFTYDGELQCMPQNISSLVVYYNTKLFAETGIDRPPADWTWEDFRQAGLELTRDEVRGIGIEPSIIRIAPFVWSNGGDVVDDTESPTRFTLDTPEARAALEFIVSLVRDDAVVPTEEEIAAQNLETRFVSGKLGMLLSSRRDTPVFREVPGLFWDVLPLPVRGEPAGILHSDAYCVARGADADLAMEFIAFATGERGQTVTAVGGRTVPSLRAIAESPAFLDPIRPPRHSRVFLDGIPHIRRTPVIPTWPEIEDVTEEILTRLFYEDDYSLDRAFEDLDDQTTPLFEEGAPR